MRGAIPPPLYVLMALCLIKHGDYFAFQHKRKLSFRIYRYICGPPPEFQVVH
jgi:hypothetical protein